MLELNDAPRRDIQVQGLILSAALIYEEGHELNEGEAGVMNQTWVENLRNNFANQVKKACDENKVEDAADLPDDVKAKLQQSFNDYMEGYKENFGTGARTRGEVDPVKRQALALAVDQVKKSLKNRGHKLSEVGAERINELAAAAIEKNPNFMLKAQQIVDARKAAAEELSVDV